MSNFNTTNTLQYYTNNTNKLSSSICPSICIPRVLTHIAVKDIIQIFQNNIKLGVIKKVESIPYEDDIFKKIFIHFEFWNDDDENVFDIKNKLLNGENIKIVYNNPWFWKCYLSRRT
jgi:hypothetical protein